MAGAPEEGSLFRLIFFFRPNSCRVCIFYHSACFSTLNLLLILNFEVYLKFRAVARFSFFVDRLENAICPTLLREVHDIGLNTL